jgi:hypothetical protein
MDRAKINIYFYKYLSINNLQNYLNDLSRAKEKKLPHENNIPIPFSVIGKNFPSYFFSSLGGGKESEERREEAF